MNFVRKLASQNTGDNCLLVADGVFFAICQSQSMKTRFATHTLQAFKKIDFSKKKTLRENFGLINKQYKQKNLQKEGHQSLLNNEWSKVCFCRESYSIIKTQNLPLDRKSW